MRPSNKEEPSVWRAPWFSENAPLAVLAATLALAGLVLLAPALLLAVRLSALLLAALTGLVLLLLALAGAALAGLVLLAAALVAALLAVRVVLFLVGHYAFPFVFAFSGRK